jgi:hypothetical protein
MTNDAAIAIRDCLAEIAVLEDLAAHLVLETFKGDPISRRAAAYAIQTISEAFRTNGLPTIQPCRGRKSTVSAIAFVTSISVSMTRSFGKSSQ